MDTLKTMGRNFICLLNIIKTVLYLGYFIKLATKWLRILSTPPNEKIRNHLVINPIYVFAYLFSMFCEFYELSRLSIFHNCIKIRSLLLKFETDVEGRAKILNHL